MPCDNGKCPCISHLPGGTTNCELTEPPKCPVCCVRKVNLCQIAYPCQVCGAGICTSCGPGLWGQGHKVCPACLVKEAARM